MRFRPSVIASFCASTAVLVLGLTAACTTDYQLGKGDPSFGGPNALAGQRPPSATIDIQAEGGAATGAGGSAAACVAAGGALADGGTCAVSFSKEILAAFGTAGCSGVTCHGGVTPLNDPRIEPSDGPAMWQEFQAFRLSNGKPYINPCSTDPATSTMGCNLLPGGAAGACGAHMPQGGADLPADVLAKITTWQKCGAPNN